jgi:hypothetical protein
MPPEEKLKILQSIFWDYNANLLPLDKIISRELNKIDEYDLRIIINRIFERLNWYDILDILGLDIIKNLLENEKLLITKNKKLKEKYERLRRILFKKPLSISGWDIENNQRIKFTLLSNRWYRT